MRREDLFNAIGMVDENCLDRCEKKRNPSVVTHREDSKMKNGKYVGQAGHKGIKRVWLIAAMIALMLFLMGSAITALVTMKVYDVKVHIQSGETHEGEKVNFGEVHDVFIELGSWYPQEIPDGYTMTFVSEGAPYQNQNIIYENDAGDEIWYWIFVADPASNVEIYHILNKTEVEINGQDGILYEQTGDYRRLVWIDEDRGFGFKLRTGDTAVDLIAMAESTAEGEPLEPTLSEETQKAIQELGDFSPTYLPEGFEEQGVQASPLSSGGGWYSYVRKWYVNKAANTQIYFEYETYVIAAEDGYADDAKTVCSFRIPGCNILEGIIVGDEVEIGGMYGLAADNDIAWADPETHVVYHLYSEDVTGEELLKVAQSIIENQ